MMVCSNAFRSRFQGGKPLLALTRREFHTFEGGGRNFLYLVPSAAVFELDEPGRAVLDFLEGTACSEDAVVAGLASRFPAPVVRDTIVDLLNARAIGYEHRPDEPPPKQLPMMPFPL